MSTEPQQLSREQIERIEIAMFHAAPRGNWVCQAIVKAVKGKTLDEKRKIFSAAYKAMFEAMLLFQMAMDSSKRPEDVRAFLSGGRRDDQTDSAKV